MAGCLMAGGHLAQQRALDFATRFAEALSPGLAIAIVANFRLEWRI
jgi:uncharacterized protein YoaH (UPF0181 family)